MRADARRNRERIVERAASLLARSGAAVQMEDIAREAGVGVGTLYRHFPDKLALVDALAAARLTEVTDAAVRRGDGAGEGGRVVSLLRDYFREAADDRALRFALTGPERARDTLVEAAIVAAEPDVATLIARDVADGVLRPDVDFATIRALCAAVVLTMDSPLPPDAWRSVLAVVEAGLRP